MNYSIASIANLALGRIGARGDITDINENTPNAKKVLNVWDAIFQEVMAERDWKFAKVRIPLQRLIDPTTQLPYVPLYGWLAAWALPSDFLRFVRPRKRQDPDCSWWAWGPWPGYYQRFNPPFWPPGFDYIVEAVTVNNTEGQQIIYQQCVLTNYIGCQAVVNGQTVTVPAAINYIRLITDMTSLQPGFVNCLAFRLAQELAIAITEDKQKAEGMHQMYLESLNSAEAQNETMDFQKDETGSTSWLRAGRNAGNWNGYGWGGGDWGG